MSSSRLIRPRKFHCNSDRLVPGIGRATECFRYVQRCHTVSSPASVPSPTQRVQYRRSGQYYRFSAPHTLTKEEKETMFEQKAMMEKLLQLLETLPDSASRNASVERDENEHHFECKCEAECEFDCECGYDDNNDDDDVCDKDDNGSVGVVSSAGSCEEDHGASRKRPCGEIAPEHEAQDGSVVEALRRLYHPGRMVRRRLANDDSTPEPTPEHEPKTRGSVDPCVALVTPTKAPVSALLLPEKSTVLEQQQTTTISGSGSDDDTNDLLDGTGYHDDDDGCCYDLDLEIAELFSEDFVLEWGGSEDGKILHEENNETEINHYGDDTDEAKIGVAIALDTIAIASSDTIGLPPMGSVDDHADSFGE